MKLQPSAMFMGHNLRILTGNLRKWRENNEPLGYTCRSKNVQSERKIKENLNVRE